MKNSLLQGFPVKQKLLEICTSIPLKGVQYQDMAKPDLPSQNPNPALQGRKQKTIALAGLPGSLYGRIGLRPSLLLIPFQGKFASVFEKFFQNSFIEKPCSLLFLAAIWILFGLSDVNAQGCSDAGICTLNSFKPHAGDSLDGTFKNQFKIGLSYGLGDRGISVIANYLEYNRQLSEKFSADVKLTSISQSGNGISSLGLSDLFLNANVALSKHLSFTAGAKIPLNDANRQENGLALPLDYQTSLGTLDLILGLSYQLHKIHFALALQQPLTDNGNAFFAEKHTSNTELSNFQSTNRFNRQADALMRISYPIKLKNEKLSFRASMLWIYHVGNDTYTDLQGIVNEIEGSRGLTMNVNAFLDYAISEKQIIQVSLGAPAIWRKARPDGLTRYFMFTAEYRIRF